MKNGEGPPVIGDDIESQVGTTIVDRTLTPLFHERDVKLERTYDIGTLEGTSSYFTEEFISRYGRGSAEPFEHRTATAQD